MSYALDFAPDAYSQWRELEPQLQELALDEADRAADNPPPPPVQEMVRDVVRRGRCSTTTSLCGWCWITNAKS